MVLNDSTKMTFFAEKDIPSHIRDEERFSKQASLGPGSAPVSNTFTWISFPIISIPAPLCCALFHLFSYPVYLTSVFLSSAAYDENVNL